MDEHAAEQRQQEPAPREAVIVRGDRAAERDRDDRRGEERQPGREEERPERGQPRPRADLVHVPAGLGDGALGVLEERDLGLVPAGRPFDGDGDVVAGDASAAPAVDVAALVVADAGLRPDVAEQEPDLLAVGRQHGGGDGPDDDLGRYRRRR